MISIGEKITNVPKNFKIHKTLKKIFDTRAQAIKEGKAIDWSTAESLAFGSLLTEGFPLDYRSDSREGLLVKHAV